MKQETTGCLSKTKSKRTKKKWVEKKKGAEKKKKEEKKGDRCSGSELGCLILFEGVQYFNIYI